MATRFVPAAIRSGLEVLATERERTAAERDAFKTFRTQVAAIEPPSKKPASDRRQHSAAQRTLTRQSCSSRRLQRIRHAYRENVMDVPHYEDEYDDSLAESLAGEFGAEVAGALLTGDQFTCSLREQLLTASQQASTQRTNFLTVLTREVESLQAAEETITALGTTLDTLDTRSLEPWSPVALADSHEQFLKAEKRCKELARERQTTLQSRGLPGPTPADLDLDLAEYLYRSLSVTHPVLADLADLAETLQTERCRVKRAMQKS